MSNPSGRARPSSGENPPADESPTVEAPSHAEASTEEARLVDRPTDPPTEVIPRPSEQANEPPERRFTAPSGFDYGRTEIIQTSHEAETEEMPVPRSSAPTEPVSAAAAMSTPRAATPQTIPPRADPRRLNRSWGWVLLLVLVIIALAFVAVWGTIMLTRSSSPKPSQEELVKQAIQEFDTAIQAGNLPRLRNITCGTTKRNYDNYPDTEWATAHDRVSAAKQYPVVATIDQVVVNDDHAEANVTSFMAYAPQVRSTRSFDLEFHDGQWKICQEPFS